MLARHSNESRRPQEPNLLAAESYEAGSEQRASPLAASENLETPVFSSPFLAQALEADRSGCLRGTRASGL